jgi:hypothetical protein
MLHSIRGMGRRKVLHKASRDQFHISILNILFVGQAAGNMI